MNITNEQIISTLVSNWTLEKPNNTYTNIIIRNLVKYFWPDLAASLDELSLSWQSEIMLKQNILEPFIFENSHLSIGMSTSQYLCPNCDKSVNMKIINEYRFIKD